MHAYRTILHATNYIHIDFFITLQRRFVRLYFRSVNVHAMGSRVRGEIKALLISDDLVAGLVITVSTLIFECTFDSRIHSIVPRRIKNKQIQLNQTLLRQTIGRKGYLPCK